MTNLSKKHFTTYVESECDRRLVIDLGNQNPLWFSPLRLIIPRNRIFRNPKGMLDLGHEYEQDIYNALIQIPNSLYRLHPNPQTSIKEVISSPLTQSIFQNFYNQYSQNPTVCTIALEHEITIPVNFINNLFGGTTDNNLPVQPSVCRPDIIILGNPPNAVHWNSDGQFQIESNSVSPGCYNLPVRELLPNGNVRLVPPSELVTRVGINIIDIKNTLPDNVSKKHFMEILFYMHVMVAVIADWGLTDKFFVRIDNNGILPRVESVSNTTFPTIIDVFKQIQPLGWDKTFLIYILIRSKIATYWSQAPLDVDKVPLNIQPRCGFCDYLEDCKQTLGMNNIDPAHWSLKLIPYTTPSIAYQLESFGLKTIGDVANNIRSIPIGPTPEPIYAERPLLELRTRALILSQLITPNIGAIHTAVLPKYSPLALTFCCENDPTNDRVFGIGYYLQLSVSSQLTYAVIFDRWWAEWYQFLNQTPAPIIPIPQANIQNLTQTLNSFLSRTIEMIDVQQFAEILIQLDDIVIIPPSPNVTGSYVNQYRINYSIEWINDGPDPADEYNLAVKALKHLYLLLDLCNILELFVVVQSPQTNAFYGPELSIFYWAAEQMKDYQKLLERYYNQLIVDPNLKPIIGDLIRWITPSDSGVMHPYQPKKLYNLQNFVETAIGFPGIINYTWHEIASVRFQIKFSSRIWVDHFNYLDFGNWLEYLHQLRFNPTKAQNKGDTIKEQLFIKMKTINRLRTDFQMQARDVISQNAHSITCSAYNQVQPFAPLHLIAEVWYLYSKLNGAIQDLNTQDIRSYFPDYSIAKLDAAEISNLHVIPAINIKQMHYQFELIGLSKNVKFNEGDFVCILPDELRDIRSGPSLRMWTFQIRDMTWDSVINGYRLTTEKTQIDLFKNYRNYVQTPQSNPIWYLYPTSSDPWTNKLQNDKQDGLLQSYNLGISWLGERLAFLWNLNSNCNLSLPTSWNFDIREIYLYAPELLEQLINLPINTKQNVPKLLSPVNPVPDVSQQTAINNALQHVIFGIQGPPGTGKSQTIAVLIDEYLERNKGQKPLRILVSAFSYAAIRVIVEKVRRMKDSAQNPTAAAQAQLIFARNTNQDPIPLIQNLPHVHDLEHSNSSWKWDGKSYTVTPQKTLEQSLQDPTIIFANAHILYALKDRLLPDFSFNLIIEDEASQVPTDQILASYQYLNSTFSPITLGLLNPHLQILTQKQEIETLTINSQSGIPLSAFTQVVIVGDYNQLPPVQQIPPPKRFIPILESLFSYYVKYHKIPSQQLNINYRSHKDIVDFTTLLGIYQKITPFVNNSSRVLPISIGALNSGWIKQMLDPQKVVMTVIHFRTFDMSISPLEAHIVGEIVLNYFKLRNPTNLNDEQKFWDEEVGIVSPHNAQGRTIIQHIYTVLTTQNLTNLSNSQLMESLRHTIYSVEKFQGSDRDLIIATIGVSDRDQLEAEASFIYDLNRFNVLTSRAKSKVILCCAKNFLNYVPADQEMMDHAARIRKYAFEFCQKWARLSITNENGQSEDIQLRWH